jgi:hypothetical protein
MALAAAQVVTVLAARLDALPAYTGRVFTSRRWPLADADLPAWRLYATDEAVARVAIGANVNRHQVEIAVVGHVAATADLDDALNAMAADASAALFEVTAPTTIDELAPYALQLLGIRRAESAEGEAALGTVTLTVQAEIFVDAAHPETILS